MKNSLAGTGTRIEPCCPRPVACPMSQFTLGIYRDHAFRARIFWRGVERCLAGWWLCATGLMALPAAELDGVPLGGKLAIQVPAVSTNTSPVPDAFYIRRFEWLPAIQPPPKLQAMTFPRDLPCAVVEELLYFDERLWIIARARTGSPALAPRRLWAYTFSENRLELVKGVLDQYAPSALWGQGREVWMAVRGGAAAFHIKTYEVDGFNASQGLSATNLAGISEAQGQLLVLSENGAVFGLDRSGENFERVGSPAPVSNPRNPDVWQQLTTSGPSLLALGSRTAAGRHVQGTQWTIFDDQLQAGNPRTNPSRLQCAQGDGSGGFWVGSDSGLHWLDPSNGSADNWYWHPGVTIHSGLPAVITPATRPSPAFVAAAHNRVLAGIRERMRDRAILARRSIEQNRRIEPVTPSSRIPGAVRALHRDNQWLWLATTDGIYSGRSRVLLFHQPTRKWVGWFVVSQPVKAICTTERLVFLGLDTTSTPSGNPLLAFDKFSMTLIHSSKWVSDELTDGELGERLATLPVRERANLAFFAGDAARVVELLSPRLAEASAEELFLLAFAHDPLGLDQPAKMAEYRDLLVARWPHSPFAEAVRVAPSTNTRSSTPVAAPKEPAPSPEALALKTILGSHDTNQDGSIDAAEFQKWIGNARLFDSFDLDGDNQMGPAELVNFIQQRPQVLKPK